MARRGTVTIYLSNDEHEQATRRAKALGRSLSDHVRTLLAEEQERADAVESARQHALGEAFDEVLG